ncbi:hypothetical protein [Planctobacterium marinum]|uniref:hypothetical protein n=1 Tax=Planctobacterium marinum TaxID=1631968 RepID=UPI001E601CEF|nr:hypothetical protein [Planctobacterium marinum]MCC2607733.1 hypothetical protein [Planctobacterium marinum]
MKLKYAIQNPIYAQPFWPVFIFLFWLIPLFPKILISLFRGIKEDQKKVYEETRQYKDGSVEFRQTTGTGAGSALLLFVTIWMLLAGLYEFAPIVFYYVTQTPLSMLFALGYAAFLASRKKKLILDSLDESEDESSWWGKLSWHFKLLLFLSCAATVALMVWDAGIARNSAFVLWATITPLLAFALVLAPASIAISILTGYFKTNIVSKKDKKNKPKLMTISILVILIVPILLQLRFVF